MIVFRRYVKRNLISIHYRFQEISRRNCSASKKFTVSIDYRSLV